MTRPDDNEVMPYLAALHHLRQTEQRLGIEPRQRGDDCPTPSQLLRFAEGQTTPETARIEAHVGGCPYCQPALKSIRAFLKDEPQDEMPEDVEDPLGREVVSSKPSTDKSKPAPYAGQAAKFQAEQPAPMGAPGGDTPSDRGWAAIGGTQLAQSPHVADHIRLLDRLEHLLPVLQRDLGLPPFGVKQCLAFIRERLPLESGQRFRDHLPGWLAEFTGQLVIPAITPEVLARAAASVAASRPEPNESEWARAVRLFVFDQRLPGPDAILTLEFPEQLRGNPALPAYKRDLHREARRAYHDGMELFEYPCSA